MKSKSKIFMFSKGKNKRVNLNYRGKTFSLDIKVCNQFEKFLGLMFSRREKAEALLFDFKKPVKRAIHSFFVFFPFIAIWLDDKDKIIDFKIIRPFSFLLFPKKFYHKIIEIPLNKKYIKIMKIPVGGERFKYVFYYNNL